MATKNSMTPSGGIFQSHQGGGIGFSSPITPPRTIQQQMSQDLQRQAGERWKIQQETQRIYNIIQDVTMQRARTGDIARRAWEEYIRR